MKIKIYGYSGYTGQVNRLKEGFLSLGHSFVDDPREADLIYSNDRDFKDVKELEGCRGKKIFNILDVPIRHLNKEEMEGWKGFLSSADVVTCISETVAKDVNRELGYEAKVIYNPAKDVSYDPSLKGAIPQKFLYVGRANDPNKRFGLIVEFFSRYCTVNPKSVLAICGSENPLFGTHYGIVSDDDLNKIYNSVEIILLPSFQEGIGLSMIEGLICKKFPICCNDNETAREFLPENFLCDPTSDSIASKIKDYLNNPSAYTVQIEELGEKYKHQFDKVNICKNILNLI